MLKLTNIQGNALFIVPNSIVAMFREYDRTRIYTVAFSADQWVTETPDQILAMPEMLEVLYPVRLINQGSLNA